MPQMAPISWLSLFIFFTIIFMMFNIMNYFSTITNVYKSDFNNKIKINSLNWKW